MSATEEVRDGGLDDARRADLAGSSAGLRRWFHEMKWRSRYGWPKGLCRMWRQRRTTDAQSVGDGSAKTIQMRSEGGNGIAFYARATVCPGVSRNLMSSEMFDLLGGDGDARPLALDEPDRVRVPVPRLAAFEECVVLRVVRLSWCVEGRGDVGSPSLYRTDEFCVVESGAFDVVFAPREAAA